MRWEIEFKLAGFNGAKWVHPGRTHSLNPDLNIPIDSDLVSGHNAIWQQEKSAFLPDLMVIPTIPPKVER